MTKEQLCRKVLDDNKKTTTKIVVSNDIKGNYYSYVTDTVYLNNTESSDSKDVIVLCHECFHATQSKLLHIFNAFLSNIELLMFIAILGMKFFQYENKVMSIVYIAIASLAIIIRCLLEIPAMVLSFDMAKKYKPQISTEIDNEKSKIKFMLPLGVLNFTWLKIIRILLIVFLIWVLH